MPIYEYECNRCKYNFDVFVRSHEEKPPCCPNCSCCDTRKRVSPLGYLKHPDQSTKAQLPAPAPKTD